MPTATSVASFPRVTLCRPLIIGPVRKNEAAKATRIVTAAAICLTLRPDRRVRLITTCWHMTWCAIADVWIRVVTR
jgi:hypothetical protein